MALRLGYLRRLNVPRGLSEHELTVLAEDTDGFSFAHLAEMQVAAAQVGFVRPEGDNYLQYADR
jgi:hypothetical protein